MESGGKPLSSNLHQKIDYYRDCVNEGLLITSNDHI